MSTENARRRRFRSRELINYHYFTYKHVQEAFANTPAGGHTPQPPRATYNTNTDSVPIIISEQPHAMSDMTTNGGYKKEHNRHNNTTPPPERPTVIAMPPPPSYETASAT
jgi:hypothetical protein